MCYNTGERVLITLNSIKNQTYKDFQVVIVDDCSIDNSVELIEDWISSNPQLDVILIQQHQNLGITKVLNDALKYCKGKYIATIGDDQWYPNFLERLVPILETSNEKVALIYSKLISYDVANSKYGDILDPSQTVTFSGYNNSKNLFQRISGNVYLLSYPWLKEMLLYSNIIVANATMIKKDILISQGGFDERYEIEDYALWLKLSSSFSFIYVDEVLGNFMRYPTNFSTHNNYKMKLSVMRMFINSYENSLSKKTLLIVQNRIVTNIIELYKFAFLNRDQQLAKTVTKETIRFLKWPSYVTYKYIFSKLLKKAGLKN